MISFKDWQELDIRIGTIQSAEVVEGADKLLKLMVDLGTDQPRQIVSGIREHFEDLADLEGEQVVVLANLEPKEIYGLESQGMILAASTEEAFALLTPAADVPAGTFVK